MKRWLSVAGALAALCSLAVADGVSRLSIYIADNHATSFGWFARHTPLETEHVLLHVDDHSDAGRVGNSDTLRDGLRRVLSSGERTQRVNDWLRAGDVQAFNWIEPLMPLPVAEVRWLQTGDGSEMRRLERTAREFLDANLDHRPRQSGELGARFHCVPLDGKLPEDDPRPVLATIDLDAMDGLEPGEAKRRFAAYWRVILDRPRLTVVTFCISRPWLRDDAEAHRLTELALRAALSVDNADITFDPFAVEGPDRSEQAKQWRAKGQEPPRYRVESAPESLRQLLCLHRGRLRVETDEPRWKRLLDEWSGGAPSWLICAEDSWPSADGVWRLPSDTLTPLRVECPDGIAPRRVRWLVVEPERAVFNVLPDLPAGKVFTSAASAAVTMTSREAAAFDYDAQFSAEIWRKLADPKTGWGTVRLTAEVTWLEHNRERHALTPEIELRLRAPGTEGFRAALSEGFRRPYVFGAGLLPGGPEACAGNDCANFLVAAWRRTGRALPWCNPEQLRRWLLPVAQRVTVDGAVAIPKDSIARGLVVHLGSHVAAVWEDRAPLGQLDGGDMVVHHLSGEPELIPLAELLNGRRAEFAVLRAPGPDDAALRMAFGGDVILTPEMLRADLPASIAATVREADFAVANLECSPVGGAEGKPPGVPEKEFVFRVPAADAAAWCRRQGIDAVTLGNNHAEDAGPDTFTAGLAAFKSQLPAAGAGANLTAALEPVILEKAGLRIALFSVNLVNAGAFPAGPEKPGTLCLPQHADQLAAAMQRCRAERMVHAIIALPHWGHEGLREVAPAQREWARWLVEHGADAVIGCGPHCPQEGDAWQGRPICYSTGNLHAHPFGPPANAVRGLMVMDLDATGLVAGFRWEQ